MLERVAVYMDDVIVHWKDMATHDTHMHNTLKRMDKAGLNLNKENCVFRQPELCFLGHMLMLMESEPILARWTLLVSYQSPQMSTS